MTYTTYFSKVSTYFSSSNYWCLFFLTFLLGFLSLEKTVIAPLKKGVLPIHLETVSDSGMLFPNHPSNSLLLPCSDVSSRTSLPQGWACVWHTQGRTDRKFLQLLSITSTHRHQVWGHPVLNFIPQLLSFLNTDCTSFFYPYIILQYPEIIIVYW
jgi:hypothetical protein